MDRWMDGRLDRWMDSRMDGWKDKHLIEIHGCIKDSHRKIRIYKPYMCMVSNARCPIITCV